MAREVLTSASLWPGGFSGEGRWQHRPGYWQTAKITGDSGVGSNVGPICFWPITFGPFAFGNAAEVVCEKSGSMHAAYGRAAVKSRLAVSQFERFGAHLFGRAASVPYRFGLRGKRAPGGLGTQLSLTDIVQLGIGSRRSRLLRPLFAKFE